MKKRTRSAAKKPQRDRVPEQLATLSSGDEEARYDAAIWLGEHGDSRALVPLEMAALHDRGGFSKEGAFVDQFVSVAGTAAEALRSLYERLDLDLEDERRLLAMLAMPLTSDRLDMPLYVFYAARGKARPLASHATHDPDPLVRMRAQLILAWLDDKTAAHLWTIDDEDVRVMATQRQAGHDLINGAMAHFPTERSARVRLAIAEMWLRYQKGYGGALYESHLIALLSDPDPRIRAHAVEMTSDRHKLREIYPTTRVDELLARAKG